MTLEEAQVRAREIKEAFEQGKMHGNRQEIEKCIEEIDRITREHPEVKEIFRDGNTSPREHTNTRAYPCRDFDD
ncbi:MAG: hypothetical protein HY617_01975 [Candidatus Sungbacteria bacterium]|nr:hypothetical protein [Candidatus Sungbacteria bacterium]